MTTRQTGRQAKTKAEAKVDPGVITNKPGGKTERQTKAAAKVDARVINKPIREVERRNPRARSRSVAAPIDQAGATTAAADGTVVHNKSEQTRSRSKRAAARADVQAGSVTSTDQPTASTKRAKLITMLERSDGASVAEIGQRLGWLPHTVRAAVTGLRRAGRAATRSKDADDRSVYRLAPVETSDKR